MWHKMELCSLFFFIIWFEKMTWYHISGLWYLTTPKMLLTSFIWIWKNLSQVCLAGSVFLFLWRDNFQPHFCDLQVLLSHSTIMILARCMTLDHTISWKWWFYTSISTNRSFFQLTTCCHRNLHADQLLISLYTRTWTLFHNCKLGHL